MPASRARAGDRRAVGHDGAIAQRSRAHRHRAIATIAPASAWQASPRGSASRARASAAFACSTARIGATSTSASLLVPAVVVGAERERREAELGLARELRLLQVGHADHRRAPGAVEVRLGARRELRPFHADVGRRPSCTVAPAPRAAAVDRARQRRADRIAELHVRDDAVAEEGRAAARRCGR